MFASLLTDPVTLNGFLLCFGAAALCGVLIALTYKNIQHSTKNFTVTVAVLPAIVMTVILMVNGNLGVGVAVAGSFSLVRFRSLPGKASDIAVIFLAMGAGLACGMGYAGFAILMSILVAVLFVLFFRTDLLSSDQKHRYITITIPEELDYAGAFKDLFDQYTSSCRLQEIRTVNLGSLYQLSYEADLRDENKEKEFLDQIRTRNGNLTVRSSLAAPAAYEL